MGDNAIIQGVVIQSPDEIMQGIKDRHEAFVRYVRNNHDAIEKDVAINHQKVVDYFDNLPPVKFEIKPLNAQAAAMDPNTVVQAVADTLGPQLQQQQYQQQLAAYNQQPYMQGCGCGCPCQCHAYHQALHGQPAQQYYVSAQQQPGLGIMRLT